MRRAAAALTVPLVLASAIAPTVALASPVSRLPPGTPERAADPIGGDQLAGRGIIAGKAPGVPPAPRIKAASYLVADGDTGEVLAAKDPHGHYLPASTLKTLTSVSLIPRLDPNGLIRPSQRTCDVEGTKVGMTPKLRYKVSDLFRALLMVSGNDAALALTQAEGGMKQTLATMNAEAQRLQANDTLAGSPNGLDVDLGLNVKTQHTSSYDLGLIMRQGLRLPAFRSYIGTLDHFWQAPPTKKQRKKGKKTGGYPIHSHIRLLPGQGYAYPGMIGGKNGYTNAAGQTFVGAARRDGHTIIIALMRGETLWNNATKLLDWGFAARGKVAPVGTLVEPVDSTKQVVQRERHGVLPANPLSDSGSSGGWGTLVAGGAGVALAVGGLLLFLRRRRRLAALGPDYEHFRALRDQDADQRPDRHRDPEP